MAILGVDPFPDTCMRLFIPILLLVAITRPRAELRAQTPIPPTTYELLRAEHARGTDMRAIDAALLSGDPVRQTLAARAVGRFEQSAFEPKLIPLLSARSASVSEMPWVGIFFGTGAVWAPAVNVRAKARARAVGKRIEERFLTTEGTDETDRARR